MRSSRNVQRRLRDFCQFYHGGTPSKANPRYWKGTIPWVSPKDMRVDIIIDSEDHITEQAIAEGTARILPRDTVLVVVRSGILVRRFPVALTAVPVTVNQDMKAIRPDPAVCLPGYLYWALRERELTIVQQGVKKGPTVHSILSGFIENLELCLPPLDEQRRIAAMLTEQMEAVERARAAVEEQLAILPTFVEACLRQSLSDSSAFPVTLADALTETSRGVGPSWAEFPLLGATRAGIAPAKEPVGKNPERYKVVDRGTVFYNPMRILLGSIAMVDDEQEPGITSPDYVVLKTKPGVMHHRWFYYWLRSTYGDRFIKSLARGAVRERILFRRLATATICIPPWDVQVACAERLRAAPVFRMHAQSQHNLINLMPAALLRRAFNGQHVAG